MRAAAASEPGTSALPPLFRHHIRRPRLTRLLDASTARISLLVAPAGYGKTTLAAEWLQGRPEEEVAWYYASPASADVAALSVGIAEAVSHILPAGDLVRQRLRVPQVPENHAEILAELLARDLTQWPENAWLVLDDYHHAMDSRSAERFVEELVRLSPIRLLITSRRRPTWITARRVVYGEVHELTTDRLAMTSAEASAILTQQDPHASRESAMVESWPALVGLAVMTNAPSSDSPQLKRALFQYFADEVLRLEAPDRQRFLMSAAVAPYVTPQIAALLPSDVPSSAISDYVENGLLRREGSERAVFHPLLRSFLRAQLLTEDAQLAHGVSEVVFSHLLLTGDWHEALRMAVDVGAGSMVARAFSEAAQELFKRGQVNTIERAAAKLPPDLQRTPEVALARAEAALWQGRFREGSVRSRHIAETGDASAELTVQAWILHGRAHHLMSDLHAALQAYEHASRDIDLVSRRQVDWGRFIVACELGLEDVDDRLSALAASARDDANARLRLATGRMLVSLQAGDGGASRRAMAEALALVQLADDPLAISHALVVSIALEVAGGRYADALKRADRAASYCRSLRLDFAHTYSMAYRAGAEIGLRRLNDARQSFADIDATSLPADDSHMMLLRAILGLKLQIAGGNTANLTRSCPSDEVLDFDTVPAAQAGELLALEALIHAANGDCSALEEKAHRARILTSDRTTCLYADYAALIGQCHTKAGGTATRLSETLVETARSCQLDVFVNAYRAWPELLACLPPLPETRSIVRLAIKEARDEGIISRGGPALGGILSPAEAQLHLTPREREVAALLAQGLSNSEIACRLFIAPSTAKVHVRHILKKLGARSRVEAALRWSEIA